jgi:hypothetical protein
VNDGGVWDEEIPANPVFDEIPAERRLKLIRRLLEKQWDS